MSRKKRTIDNYITRRVIDATQKRFSRISGVPANDSIATPDPLFIDLNNWFHFTHDPCPLNGKENADTPDGLETGWGFTTFVNPPYSNIASWLSIAVNNLVLYGTRSVFLIPAHVETMYWFNYVTQWASEVWFCVTGLRFTGYKEKFTQPMTLVIYGQFADVLSFHHTGDTIRLGQNLWSVVVLARGLSNQRLRLFDK